ncbi:MAG TPA: hypothetical protein VM370_02075 [Candidatus Thermoplasmatota archaeon]|nr:hypothetical protein [Candidatus Thermoplasmatota archaeon]
MPLPSDEVRARLLDALAKELPAGTPVEVLPIAALDAPDFAAARADLADILSADPAVVDLSFHPVLVESGLPAPALAVLLMSAGQGVGHRVKLYALPEKQGHAPRVLVVYYHRRPR